MATRLQESLRFQGGAGSSEARGASPPATRAPGAADSSSGPAVQKPGRSNIYSVPPKRVVTSVPRSFIFSAGANPES